MRNFVTYWDEENPDDKFPRTESVSGEWFAERRLPMIVACTCCEMTMALPSAMVDDDGYIFCSSCSE